MNIDLINKFIESYPPGDELIKPDEEIIEFGKKILPTEIVYLWEHYGFGDYGNGIIKVINPKQYMRNLYSWLGKEDLNKIPIMMTAFGDLFYFRKLDDNVNDISLLDIHYRKTVVCTYSYQEFFESFLLLERVKEEILRAKLYNDAINQFGKLKHFDIFYFAPPLAMGGLENIENIKKGNAMIQQDMLFQLGNK